MAKNLSHKNKSVSVHQFAMAPRADIPRSSFRVQTTHKTTFDAGYLVPFYVDEILPGDTFSLQATCFARLATPLFPFMDNLHLDTFYFFVPNRLVWTNWQRFMGEQDNPGDSTDFVIPQAASPEAGYAVNSLQDYFGLPTVGQIGAESSFNHMALPLRAYNKIWNDWFRDENLQDSRPLGREAGVLTPGGDGPDNVVEDYTLMRRGKRHDYITSCLPFAQKGDPVTLPLGDTAPVTISPDLSNPGVSNVPLFSYLSGAEVNQPITVAGSTGDAFIGVGTGGATQAVWGDPALTAVADLSSATAATINAIRQAFQIQKFLERDARGGSRYTELVRSHFGVISPDARLQRAEYLGGSTQPVSVTAVPQTAPGAVDSAFSVGSLGGAGTVMSRSGFTQSFTEHGFVIGLVSVRADLTYQQGIRRFWNRSTKFDLYWPVFSALGEQAVINREIYAQGTAVDDETFGFQERWAEYRYNPAMVTGYMRSTAAQSIDAWHLAQEFTELPTLNDAFIQENPPLERVIAVGSEAAGVQFLFDSFIDIREARPMPLYSVPGMIDHF